MTKRFTELEAKMRPDSRARSDALYAELVAAMSTGADDAAHPDMTHAPGTPPTGHNG